MSSPSTPTLRGPDVGIPPRRMHFDHAPDMPRYMYGDNATASMLFAVLSGFFPPGEQFFVDSVRHYRTRVTDPTLKAQVSGFVGQEAIHSAEHDRLNEFFLDRGIDLTVADRAVRTSLAILERLPARSQLACTAFMEHFTALLGEQLLTHDDFRARANPDALPMWMWHALEELEHKSVSYDVYEVVGNRRLERILAIPVVAATMLPAILASWAYLLVREGTYRNPDDLLRGIGILFGRRGFVTRILRRLPAFGLPDYHPARHDTSAIEAEWRERLFGEDGALLDQARYLPT